MAQMYVYSPATVGVHLYAQWTTPESNGIGPAIDVTVWPAPSPWSWSSENTTVSPALTRVTSGSKNRGAMSPTSTTTVLEDIQSGAPAMTPQSTSAKVQLIQFIGSIAASGWSWLPRRNVGG